MFINIEHEINNNILIVKLKGEYSEGSAKSTFIEILNVLHERKMENVLADCSSIENLHNNTMISFGYAKFIAKEIGNRKIFPKIAYLLSKDDHLELRYFAEDVAVNRGVNVKIFIDRNEAVTWLEHDRTLYGT